MTSSRQAGDTVPNRRIWRPQLNKPFSTADMEKIVNDAIAVLQKIGVYCKHPETIKRMTAIDGIDYHGERLRFSKKPVWNLIEHCRRHTQPMPPPADGKFVLAGCSWALFYCDPETLEVRKATTPEARRMARFWDARDVGGGVPLLPGDVPPELVSITAEHIALTESRKLGGGLAILDPEEVRYHIDMNLAAGRKYLLMQEVPISPLRFNSEGLNVIYEFLDNPDVNLFIAGPIPIAGATTPIEPRAALIQSLAEELAYSLLRFALTGEQNLWAPRLDPLDMQYAIMTVGSPEWCLLTSMRFQVYEFMTGQTIWSGGFRSMAKQPDAQAVCEKTASMMWQALLGVWRFGSVGQLSMDEVFSPQQAIIDIEIAGYVERLFQGLNCEEHDPVAMIAEGVEAGGFTGLASTAERFREFFWFPQMFKHWNVGGWHKAGAPRILNIAWEKAQQKIAESTYALPDDQQKEVDRIFQKAIDYIHRRPA